MHNLICIFRIHPTLGSKKQLEPLKTCLLQLKIWVSNLKSSMIFKKFVSKALFCCAMQAWHREVRKGNQMHAGKRAYFQSFQLIYPNMVSLSRSHLPQSHARHWCWPFPQFLESISICCASGSLHLDLFPFLQHTCVHAHTYMCIHFCCSLIPATPF